MQWFSMEKVTGKEGSFENGVAQVLLLLLTVTRTSFFWDLGFFICKDEKTVAEQM